MEFDEGPTAAPIKMADVKTWFVIQFDNTESSISFSDYFVLFVPLRGKKIVQEGSAFQLCRIPYVGSHQISTIQPDVDSLNSESPNQIALR